MLSQSLKRIAKKISAKRLDSKSLDIIRNLYMTDSDMYEAATTAWYDDTTEDLISALEVLAQVNNEEIDDEGMLYRGQVSEQLIDEAEADVMMEWKKWSGNTSLV